MTSSQILSLVDIFADLNQSQLDLIYEICKHKSYKKDELIFEEGSPSSDIYIVIAGQVNIQLRPNVVPENKGKLARPIDLTIVEKGQSFGEIALVDQGLRSASAVCGSDTCNLLEINRDDFMHLMQIYLDMGFTVMFNLAADLCLKIRQTTFKVR